MRLGVRRSARAAVGVAAIAMAGLVGAPAMLFASATPALAEGPPVASNCTFDQATGVQTCVTTTAPITTTYGPFTTQGSVPVNTVFGVYTGKELCQLVYGTTPWLSISLSNVSYKVTTTTTTTTENHGLRGSVFSSSSTISIISFDGFIGPNPTCYVPV